MGTPCWLVITASSMNDSALDSCVIVYPVSALRSVNVTQPASGSARRTLSVTSSVMAYMSRMTLSRTFARYCSEPVMRTFSPECWSRRSFSTGGVGNFMSSA